MIHLLNILAQYNPDPDGSLEGWKPAAKMMLYIGSVLLALVLVLLFRKANKGRPLGDVPTAMMPVPQPRGFEPVTDGPGKYQVRGVDKATKMDTTWVCNADSRENARIKGHLEGIIVSGVERVG